jgi:1-acylglycerone phosphate reductase
MASEIWRHELQPLGVRVITLITTSVKTSAFDKSEKPVIPETSYYYVIRDYLARITDGRLQDGAPDPRTYALKVVREVEKGAAGEVWVGKDAGMSRLMCQLLPKSIFVSIG